MPRFTKPDRSRRLPCAVISPTPIPCHLAHWFYALSLGLLALLATQGIIVDGHKLRPAAATHGLGTLVGPAFCIFRQFNLIYRPAATWTAVIIIACPVAAKCVGAAVNRLVAP